MVHFYAFCAMFEAFCELMKISNFTINRGIPGQVRRLIDTMKNDSVSLIYGTVLMHALVHKF